MSNSTEIDAYKNEQFDEEGFEDEDLGDQDGIAKPFDPNKVDVNISTPNLGALISRLENNEIDLMPEFQRSPDLWSKQAQSRLIESILIRLPIPAFYFDAYEDEKWQVVDGLQRLSAINNFVIKKTLALTNLEFLTDYEGKKFDELPRSLTRRIDEFQTSVYLIKPGTPTLIKYALFNRINTGGLKLTPQEIRHAMSQSVRGGIASKFLTNIVHEDSFKLVVRNKSNRQAHQELVLRHMAFTLFGTQGYKSSLPKFLDSAMIELGELSNKKLDQLSENFIETIKMAYKIFEEDAFKRSLADQHTNKVVNKPLFEAVSVSLARLSLTEREALLANKAEFRSGLRTLLQDAKFIDSITLSTANTESVLIRFDMVQHLISKILIEK